MKRILVIFPAIVVALLLVAASLIGSSMAKTATPTFTLKPLATISPLPVSFSGGMSTVTGNVSDGEGNGIPGAKVTLYYAVWIGNDYKAKDPVVLKGVTNPQYTGDGSTSPAGSFVFTNIPPAIYVLTAEKGGVSVSKNIMVTGGMARENLVIQQYIDDTPTPVPSASTPAPSLTAWPTIKPTTAPPADAVGPDVGAMLYEGFRIIMIGIVCLQLAVGVVAIAVQAGWKRRKK